MTDMERFSVFLRYAENPDYREIVNKVIESKEGLAVAGELLMSIDFGEIVDFYRVSQYGHI